MIRSDSLLPEYACAGALGTGLVNKSSYLMRILATTHELQVQFAFSSERYDPIYM